MSDIRQQTTFEKVGLDSDDSYAFMPNGSSPYNLNILVGEDGSQGIVTNSKGNKLISYDQELTLSNCYETKGSYYNNLTRKCYFFLFSQPYLNITDPSPYEYLYDNRLLCFNEDTLTIDTIFLDIHNWFEIDPAQHLTDIKMLGSWLFFNPVTAQPKMIDIDMAYNYTNYPAWDDTDVSAYANLGDIYTWKGGLFVSNTTITAGQDPSTSNTKWDRIGDSYQDESTIIDTEFSKAFFAIKVPPLDRLDVSYGSDATKNFNSVRGKLYRFCHRYQYFDNTYSVCSAHSKLTLPDGDELYNGEATGGLTLNNYIKIYFSLYSAALVKNIEILFQEVDGDWRRATIINRQDQTLLDDVNYTYNFYNNDSYPIIDQLIPYVIQDAVPDRVSSQEIINKNVLCYARCREGKPNIDKDLIDVTLTPELSELTVPQTLITTRRNLMVGGVLALEYCIGQWRLGYTAGVPAAIVTEYTTSQYLMGYFGQYGIRIPIGNWFPGGGVVAGDAFEIQFGSYKLYLKLTPAMVVSAITLCAAIQNGLKYIAGYDNVILIDNNGTGFYILNSSGFPPTVTTCRFINASVDVDPLFKTSGFKSGAYHPFCLFYYDEALRRSDAQVVSDMSVYVPSFNEYSPPLIDGTNFKWSIDWAVSHEPPAWAKYWRWGYAGNRRCSYFVQYIISSIEDTNVPDPSAPEDVANTVKVDLTPLQSIKTTTDANWNSFPNSIIPAYTFIEGDRIRFITKETVPATASTTLGDVIDGTYDFEIIKFDDASSMAYIKSSESDLTDIGINTLAEIYTPLKDTDFLDATKTLTYYEFGDLMPIIEDVDGNLVHGGKTQNQALTASPVPAKGTFSNGDVYHIMRTPSKPLCTNTPTDYLVGAFHESMWWSDFYKSDDWDRGKLGLESPVGEVTLNIIRYSNVYLQNTAVNGITTLEADHYKELNDVFGKIISIVEVGDTLKCYQEKKPSSILVGRTEYKDDGSGNGNVVISSAILGAIRYSNTNYGTTFPESISKNNRYVYGYDIYNGVVWRDSANGIFPISGRYSDIGASVDYKMQSYFKAKSKLLLTSGVEHCHVLTVWDEEYKMLYVSFKDTVNEANNETVVFHEPSDRWITFTEFEYTPAEGYNQMLELTYSVVKGFENGIGYEFDLLTRFAKFNIGGGIGTSPNVHLNPLAMTMAFVLPDPVVTYGSTTAPTAASLILALPTPDVHISWIVLSQISFSWDADQVGTLDGIQFTVTTSEAYVTVIGSVDWLTAEGDAGILSVGDHIPDGGNVWLYPKTVNTGIERASIFDFVSLDTWGDTVDISVTQLVSAANPIITVAKDVYDTSNMTIVDASGSGSLYSSIVNITFTPNLPTEENGGEFTIYWQATKDIGGFTTEIGHYYFLGRNQIENSQSLSLTVNSEAGEVITINISSLNIY